jgi:hypothetical protein
MFATLALRSIKCVNSNLLGNLEFQIAHYGLIAKDAETANDSGRSQAIAGDDGRLRGPVLAGLLELDSDRLLRALVRRDPR